MRDDGAGVPLEAVRRKAIKRGLLGPHQEISDRDVLQFILQPGFSTAEKITQISGRGVGMDVVHEEVRQLGGSMVIDSTPGEGVHFRIRLPFTVSVNRALMVQCADDQYAIPLNTIEGLVRVLPMSWRAITSKTRRVMNTPVSAMSCSTWATCCTPSAARNCWASTSRCRCYWCSATSGAWPSMWTPWPVRGRLWSGPGPQFAGCRACRARRFWATGA